VFYRYQKKAEIDRKEFEGYLREVLQERGVPLQ
jgi:hypothetical protein